ncbi:MAG: hypothetical protein HXY25_05720 [Alphaproteobacteria bacterium]|nr:hypothetical protein [Alphaproteobacteria bacterium]
MAALALAYWALMLAALADTVSPLRLIVWSGLLLGAVVHMGAIWFAHRAGPAAPVAGHGDFTRALILPASLLGVALAPVCYFVPGGGEVAGLAIAGGIGAALCLGGLFTDCPEAALRLAGPSLLSGPLLFAVGGAPLDPLLLAGLLAAATTFAGALLTAPRHPL